MQLMGLRRGGARTIAWGSPGTVQHPTLSSGFGWLVCKIQGDATQAHRALSSRGTRPQDGPSPLLRSPNAGLPSILRQPQGLVANLRECITSCECPLPQEKGST